MWQAHGVSLGLAQTLVVACTSTLAAVGAAAIPSAGLVTMLMVLQVGHLNLLCRSMLCYLSRAPPWQISQDDFNKPGGSPALHKLFHSGSPENTVCQCFHGDGCLFLANNSKVHKLRCRRLLLCFDGHFLILYPRLLHWDAHWHALTLKQPAPAFQLRLPFPGF